MIYAPDYYRDFRCIAGACRHSCCVGWEIDLDEETRAAYAAVEGPLGEKLAASIADGEDGEAHFRLTGEERCPFLQRDGLCELILTLGEDCLCQICADHPRFRQFYGGRTEVGLGLCCEAAGERILFYPAPMRLLPLENDGDESLPTDEEEAFLAWREGLLAIAGDRSVPLDERLATVLREAGADEWPVGMTTWQRVFRGLERLDPSWDGVLDTLCDRPAPQGWDEPFARLLEYFLYRHLSGGLADGRYAERAAFAVLSVRVIRALFAAGAPSRERLVELARQYSSEVEYDEDNVETLLLLLCSPETAENGLQ